MIPHAHLEDYSMAEGGCTHCDEPRNVTKLVLDVSKRFGCFVGIGDVTLESLCAGADVE